MGSTGGTDSTAAEKEEPPEEEFSEIFKTRKNKWVAVVVTRRDKNLQPVAGRVVADDIDRYRLRQKIIGQKVICIFYAGEPQYPLLL